MTIFHLSDLHIGIRLYEKDMYDDQKHVLDQIVAVAEKQHPDAVVIAGDIYDKALPSTEAVTLFDGFVTNLKEASSGTAVMIISGNHDSAPRINAYRNILKAQGVHVIGMPPEKQGEHIEKLTLYDSFGPVNFYLLPFVKPSMIRGITGTKEDGSGLGYTEAISRLVGLETIDSGERNIIVSHQFYVPSGSDPAEAERSDSEIIQVGNVDAVDAGILKQFDYAALGHIHRTMRVGADNIRYSGSPLQYSVSEAAQNKSFIQVRLGEKIGGRTEMELELVPLTPLRRIRVVKGRLDEVVASGSDDYVSAVITDEAGLDAVDTRDRLKAAFPNLLEIRREFPTGAGYSYLPDDGAENGEPIPGPLELCRLFMPDMSDDQEKILKDVINTVKEATP